MGNLPDHEKYYSVQKANATRIPDAIILAYASGVAYLSAFYYERGYLSYFRAPSELIQIDLTRLLIFGVSLIAVSLFAFPILNMIAILLSRRMPPIISAMLRPYILLVFVVSAAAFAYGFIEWRRWIAFIGIFVFFAFFDFVFPLITQRAKRTYIEKLIAQAELESTRKTIPDLIRNKLGVNAVLAISIVLLSTSISWFLGNGEAHRQRDFLLTNTDPPLVVLRTYGDRILLADFDPETSEVLPSFSIVEVTTPGLRLTLEQIGPLVRLHPTPTPPPQPSPTAVEFSSNALPFPDKSTTPNVPPSQ